MIEAGVVSNKWSMNLHYNMTFYVVSSNSHNSTLLYSLMTSRLKASVADVTFSNSLQKRAVLSRAANFYNATSNSLTISKLQIRTSPFVPTATPILASTSSSASTNAETWSQSSLIGTIIAVVAGSILCCIALAFVYRQQQLMKHLANESDSFSGDLQTNSGLKSSLSKQLVDGYNASNGDSSIDKIYDGERSSFYNSNPLATTDSLKLVSNQSSRFNAVNAMQGTYGINPLVQQQSMQHQSMQQQSMQQPPMQQQPMQQQPVQQQFAAFLQPQYQQQPQQPYQPYQQQQQPQVQQMSQYPMSPMQHQSQFQQPIILPQAQMQSPSFQYQHPQMQMQPQIPTYQQPQPLPQPQYLSNYQYMQPISPQTQQQWEQIQQPQMYQQLPQQQFQPSLQMQQPPMQQQPMQLQPQTYQQQQQQLPIPQMQQIPLQMTQQQAPPPQQQVSIQTPVFLPQQQSPKKQAEQQSSGSNINSRW